MQKVRISCSYLMMSPTTLTFGYPGREVKQHTAARTPTSSVSSNDGRSPAPARPKRGQQEPWSKPRVDKGPRLSEEVHPELRPSWQNCFGPEMGSLARGLLPD
ncbi:Hypothetical predicted protein [Marmota monax]|uniref:Uncharacterized protein n=1 Tax=Marmota monax TaxID=9995 RepID=A0A5E4AH28_MARMO|nr:Hypothetical predicted protein [Marmota monax]